MSAPTHHLSVDTPWTSSKIAIATGISAGISATTAALFTSISPLGGALFGAGAFLGGHLIHTICEKFQCFPDNTLGRIAYRALPVFGGIMTGVALTSLFGFSITFASGLFLTATALATIVTVGIVFAGCMGCCVALSSAYYAQPESSPAV